MIIHSRWKINDYGIGEANTSSWKYWWLRKQIANMKYLIRLASGWPGTFDQISCS